MSTLPNAAPQPLFIPVSDFRKYGLLGRTHAYDLAKTGLLDLVKVGNRVGITFAEAVRFVGTAVPIATAKRGTSAGTAASVKSRGDRP